MPSRICRGSGTGARIAALLTGIDSGKKFVRAHQLLADCVLSRDISGAQAMLSEHLHSTINVVYPPGGN
jgi:GntR family transcriptional regulator, carbon starvation induced regulator